MKKLTLIVLAISLCLALSACERGSADGPGGSVLGDVKVGESLHLNGDYKTIDVTLTSLTLSQGSFSAALRVVTADVESPDNGVSEPFLMSGNLDAVPTRFTFKGVLINVYSITPNLETEPSDPSDSYSVRMRITDVVLG